MKSKVFKRILSAILSIQMICAFTPAIVLNANAEELQMYLNEDFTSENNKWTGKTENMGILTDEETCRGSSSRSCRPSRRPFQTRRAGRRRRRRSPPPPGGGQGGDHLSEGTVGTAPAQVL